MTGETEMKFDPELVYAEEDLVIDVQFLLQEMMDDKGITRAELARRAGISKARLTQLMRPEANPTLRTLAAIFYALGERVTVARKERSCESPSVEGDPLEPTPSGDSDQHAGSTPARSKESSASVASPRWQFVASNDTLFPSGRNLPGLLDSWPAGSGPVDDTEWITTPLLEAA